jgi:hypothetical protein
MSWGAELRQRSQAHPGRRDDPGDRVHDGRPQINRSLYFVYKVNNGALPSRPPVGGLWPKARPSGFRYWSRRLLTSPPQPSSP